VGGMPSELAVGMISVANDTRTLPQGSWILVGKLVVAILDRKFGVRVPYSSSVFDVEETSWSVDLTYCGIP
jgi:hypothetical protein